MKKQRHTKSTREEMALAERLKAEAEQAKRSDAAREAARREGLKRAAPEGLGCAAEAAGREIHDRPGREAAKRSKRPEQRQRGV